MDSFQEKYNALVIKYNALLAENEELKSELFYGTITRSDEITEVLDILVLTKTMHYEIKDRTVYIRK